MWRVTKMLVVAISVLLIPVSVMYTAWVWNSPRELRSEATEIVMTSISSRDQFHCLPLIETGAVNVDERLADGKSLLMLACDKRCDYIVSALLAVGAKTKYRDTAGMTAVDYAKLSHSKAILKMLDYSNMRNSSR